MIKYLSVLVVITAVLALPVLAQQETDTNSVDFPPTRVVAEDSRGNLVLATAEQVTSIRGVVPPAGTQVVITRVNGVSLAISGQTDVAVSNANGKIEEGDTLSVGLIPGVAVKAQGAPFIIGRALESFAPANDDDVSVGTISVALDIGPADRQGVVGFQAPGFIQSAADSVAGKEVPPVRALAAFIAVVVGTGIASLMFVGLKTSAAVSFRRNPDSRQIVVHSQRTLYLIVAVVFVTGILSAYLLLRTT